jgi:hypothetical protein
MTKFITRIHKAGGGSLRIWLEPGKPIYKDGQKTGDTPGKCIQFIGGIFETDDESIIQKLKSLPTFGIDFWEDSGEQAVQQTPKAEPELDQLTKLQLIELARSKNIEVNESLTKAEIVERLKAQ